MREGTKKNYVFEFNEILDFTNMQKENEFKRNEKTKERKKMKLNRNILFS